MTKLINACAFTLALFAANLCHAQSSTDNIALTVSTPWTFTFNTPTLLENDQTITNAFTLTVKTKSSNCSVYASISIYSTPSGFSPSYSPLDLQLTSTTSSSTSATTAAINVTTSNALLFTQSKTTSAYTFKYNMIFRALGYDWYAGNYSYTLTFTMTQP